MVLGDNNEDDDNGNDSFLDYVFLSFTSVL